MTCAFHRAFIKHLQCARNGLHTEPCVRKCSRWVYWLSSLGWNKAGHSHSQRWKGAMQIEPAPHPAFQHSIQKKHLLVLIPETTGNGDMALLRVLSGGQKHLAGEGEQRVRPCIFLTSSSQGVKFCFKGKETQGIISPSQQSQLCVCVFELNLMHKPSIKAQKGPQQVLQMHT